MDGKASPKKDRHISNTGLRGAPKKGGAGGKGTWGVGGKEDLKATPASFDPNDPNYDSEGENVEEVVLSKTEVSSPLETVIKEYFFEGDVDEAAKSLQELKLDNTHDEFVKKAVTFAMERQSYERELICKLLLSLYGKVVSPEKIAEGFQKILDRLEDIKLDTPDAAEVLSKFLARAIVDEILAPAFLKNARAETPVANEALALASALITEKHRIDRLAHVWGPGDLSSVKRLKEEASTLLEEYLTTGDVEEADRCLRKLNAPSFHFQVVKIAIRQSLAKTDEDRNKIAKLFDYLYKAGLVGHEHFSKGMSLCYELLDDLKLDVPNAATLLDEYAKRGKSEGWLASKFEAPK